MNDRLAALYHGVAIHATADREHRAALELLALVMLADHDVAENEVALVREISSDWRGEEFAFDDYLAPAVEAARAAIDGGTVTEFLDHIDDEISSRVLRAALFSTARDVADVDDTVTPEEGTILAEVAVRFG